MRNYFLFAVALIVLSCTKKPNESIDNKLKTYSINNTSESVIPWNSLIQEIKFIPLETTPNSLVSEVDHLIIDNGNIYIQNFHNQVLQFSEDGKFKGQIGRKGRGPEEYLNVMDFQIRNNYVLILDSKSIRKYDTYGNYISKLTWGKAEDIQLYANRFCYFNDNKYYLWNSSLDGTPAEQDCYLLHQVTDGKITKSLLPTQFSGMANHRFYSMPNGNYHIRPTQYDNTVYELSADTLIKAYQIDFGENNVQIAKLKKGYSSEISDYNFDYINENKKWSRVHYYFAENKQFLFFNFTSFQKENDLSWALVNKETHKTYVTQKLLIDDVLPVSMIGTDLKTDQIIGIVTPQDILKALKRNANLFDNLILSKEDLAMLNQLKETDNVVLAKVRFK
ncbi:6-bladed beta-propeller [Chondrinema litorale]|uniref:6-bladed beta-propeller n=1 Tax=Chondrinema litorale TaxID=2994555 RepID=UPI002543987F|nr:6-bladed beta-propeller [Chondrinema litorale]UZR97732.1 6-bladed beta-propeller [Chondrinema litorale]